jgi:hypothetical protein
MKNKLQKFLGLASLAIMSNQAFAQNDVSNFIRAGKDEANKLIGAYLQPVTRGMARGVNDAWYSTAKPLGLFGFDIRMGVGGSFVRDDAKNFTLNGIGASNSASSPVLLTPIGGNGDTKQPTLAGDGSSTRFAVSVLNPSTIGPQRIYTDTISAFQGQNSPVSLGAAPFVQFSMGIVKNTEVMVRILPIQNGDFSSSGFGFGVKHSISQWIWGVEKLPIDISGLFTYTNNTLSLSFGNNFLDANGEPGSLSSSEYKNSQKLEINSKGYQVGLIVSKKLAFFTPYLGVTQNSATTEIGMKGKYPVRSVRLNSTTNLPENYIENIENPINFSSTVASLRAALGFRFKLGPIALGAEYNHAFSTQQFNTFNAIFAINIQQLAPILKL